MNLLIVDDEPVIRGGLVKMAGHYAPAFTEILTAGNGEEALEVIRTREPAIVLTDIRMPKMDGLALCRTIHEQYEHIQVVVISGYGDFEYAQKCLSYGVKHYLLKPVTKSDVFEVFDNLLNSSAKGYMPVSQYLRWIEEVEQCIWSQQREEFNTIVDKWHEHNMASIAPLSQLRNQLSDSIALIVKRLQERNQAIDGSWTAPPATKKEVVDSFGAKLHDIYRSIGTARKGVYRDPLEEAKAYIDNNLANDVSLEEVAEMVGLTPTYFSALFKKLTNETFVKYRIQKRMDKAKELLAVPHMKITDVAPEVGYEDYPHFTKTFKKVVGMTPSEYRAMLGIK